MKERILKLLPKQYRFYKSKKREVIFSGSYGSGKSLALCAKILPHAMIPGNLCLITRKTRSALVSTTLRTLLNGDGKMAPILLPGTYDHNEAKSLIKIHGGGEILYKGCDDDMSIRSLNLGAVAVDEAVELTENEWQTLTSRLRSPIDPFSQIFAATNPSSPNHFLYKRWNEHQDIVEMINSTIFDNRHLPDAYVKDQVERYTGSHYQRYIMGEWTSNEGAVYKSFDQSVHICKKDPASYTEHIISLDIGFRDPTAILVSGYDKTSIHTFSEIVTNTLTPTEIVDRIKMLQSKYPCSTVVIDKSAAGVITQAESMGVQVVKSNSDINGGIQRVTELLITNQYTIDSSCVNTIKEFDLYSWKDGSSDKPEDANNHCLDSIRYSVNYWFDNKAKSINPMIYTVDVGDGIENKESWFNTDED